MSKKSFGGRVAKWLDDFKMAGTGIVLAMRKWGFWAIFLPVFMVFGTLLSMVSSGLAGFNLFFASDFGGKLSVLASALLGLFGVGRNFLDFLLVFSISLLQALLITLIVLIIKHRRCKIKPKRDGDKRKRILNKHERDDDNQERNDDTTGAIQNAGIAAGLAILGSGCPTCGTALITPILSAVFSSGSYAIAGTVSGILTTIAVLISVFSIKKLGVETYVIMLEERRKSRMAEKGDSKENE